METFVTKVDTLWHKFNLCYLTSPDKKLNTDVSFKWAFHVAILTWCTVIRLHPEQGIHRPALEVKEGFIGGKLGQKSSGVFAKVCESCLWGIPRASFLFPGASNRKEEGSVGKQRDENGFHLTGVPGKAVACCKALFESGRGCRLVLTETAGEHWPGGALWGRPHWHSWCQHPGPAYGAPPLYRRLSRRPETRRHHRTSPSSSSFWKQEAPGPFPSPSIALAVHSFSA